MPRSHARPVCQAATVFAPPAKAAPPPSRGRRRFGGQSSPDDRSLIQRLLCLSFPVVLLSSCVTGGFQEMPQNPPEVRTKEFAETMAAVAKTPWTQGNGIRTLENGGVFFPAMLKAVKGARRSITFESFINRRSLPVVTFSEAFASRARAGVKVHVILDAFASQQFGDDLLAKMRDAGVEIEFYRTFNWLRLLSYNHRTHRRVLVVDGKTGYTGGAGWTQVWIGHAQSPRYWRETQYELHGPVVGQLQDNFNDNWEELRGCRLSGPDYYPPLLPTGTQAAQMVLGSPEKMEDTLGSSMLLAIRSARRSIHIAHAYFLPCREFTKALVEALGRGVHVEIMVPGAHTDAPVVRSTTVGTLRRLIAAGAELYEFQPTMMHSKLMVIDGHLTVAGTANIDSRSFFINDENNLHVLGGDCAGCQIAMFERDKKRCRRLSVEDLRLGWKALPEAVFGHLFWSQL